MSRNNGERLSVVGDNPLMYLPELILLLGWIIFYGSVALVIAFVIWYVFFNHYTIPQEERILEEDLGESYREYKTKVPRWFGKIRR
jgi:protein-S-isoprenylcysteine O-methyltransferase Ste14